MTKTQLLVAARSVFAKKGYGEASLREIAEAVGIKTPSMYAHFPSKEALYEAVYAEVAVEHTAFFDDVIRTSGELRPLERIEHVLGSIERYYRVHPELAEFSLRSAVAEIGENGSVLREILLDSESDLAAAVGHAYAMGIEAGDFPAGDPDGFTALVLVLMDGLFLQLMHYTPDVYRLRYDQAWGFLATLLSS